MSLNADALRSLYDDQVPEKPLISNVETAEPIVPSANLIELPLDVLTDFPYSRYNRYRIYEGEAKDDLIASIRRNGILQPLVVRQLADGTMQIVDGRNRREAAKAAGYDTVPCLVRDLDDTEALRQLNFLNERYRTLLPSEKAFAYQLEAEQESAQGYNSLDSPNSTLFHDETKLKTDESRSTKWRYRQLVKFNSDEWLDVIDGNLLSVSSAIELSALPEEQQQVVFGYFFIGTAYRDDTRCMTPGIATAIKKLADTSTTIDPEDLDLLFAPKDVPPAKAIKLELKPLRKIHPQLADLPAEGVQDIIHKALELYFAHDTEEVIE